MEKEWKGIDKEKRKIEHEKGHGKEKGTERKGNEQKKKNGKGKKRKGREEKGRGGK